MPPAPSTSRTDLPDLSNCSILLVDDDADARDIFGTTLTFCGARVHAAESAAAARAHLAEARLDLIVLDLHLPGESGAEFLSWLRRQQPSQGGAIATIVVTAHYEDYPHSDLKGYAAYLRKPVSPEVLCRTVGELLGRVTRRADC